MDFRHPDGRKVPVFLPRRSLLIMSGESRYLWTHGSVSTIPYTFTYTANLLCNVYVYVIMLVPSSINILFTGTLFLATLSYSLGNDTIISVLFSHNL